MTNKYPLKKKVFTVKGFNDSPKPCPEGCGGAVEPTFNANVGKCNKCGERVAWSSLRDK